MQGLFLLKKHMESQALCLGMKHKLLTDIFKHSGVYRNQQNGIVDFDFNIAHRVALWEQMRRRDLFVLNHIN